MLPNLLAYPVAFLGAARAGLTVVNVNPLYTPRELKEQLIDCGATAIVIMENFAHKLEQVLGDTQIRHVVVARLGDFMPPIKRAVFNFANTYVRKSVPAWRFENFTLLHKACSRAPGAHYVDAAPGPTSPALLQYTGGTTGVAKAAILTHRNLVANTLQCRAVIEPYLPEEQGSVLTPLPLYHIFSLTANLLAFALMGGRSVLVPDPRDIKGLIRTIARARVATMTGVNTLFNALINNPDFAKLDFSNLKFAVGGGAAVQSAVAERWREITGTELVEGYGLTEASPVVCLNPVRRSAARHRRPAGAFHRSRHPRRPRQRSAGRRGRRDLRARARRSCRAIGTVTTKASSCSPRTAGCIPAISAPSTPTAI